MKCTTITFLFILMQEIISISNAHRYRCLLAIVGTLDIYMFHLFKGKCTLVAFGISLSKWLCNIWVHTSTHN